MRQRTDRLRDLVRVKLGFPTAEQVSGTTGINHAKLRHGECRRKAQVRVSVAMTPREFYSSLSSDGPGGLGNGGKARNEFERASQSIVLGPIVRVCLVHLMNQFRHEMNPG